MVRDAPPTLLTNFIFFNMIFTRNLRIEESSQVGEARRLVATLCRELGFDDLRLDQAGLIVTELATNLVKHTGGAGGELVFCPLVADGASGLDILSLDQGPGINNISVSLRDGYSTAGSLGTGLGAIRRLSSVFDIFSMPGKGVAVLSRLWHNAPALAPILSVGAVCLPVHGEQACGDAWACKQGPEAMLFLLADGLGHGPDAAAASNQAVAIFKKNALRSPAELVSLMHDGLKGTRGAAVAVAEVDITERLVRYAGVGNISGLIMSESSNRHMASHNGTAGVEARKIQEFSCPWPEQGLLVLHSDGLATHWSLDNYPGLMLKDTALIAGVLYRDHQRLRDDSLVVVAKASGAGVWHE